MCKREVRSKETSRGATKEIKSDEKVEGEECRTQDGRQE